MTKRNSFVVIVSFSFAMTVLGCHTAQTLPPRAGDHPAEPAAALALYEPPADPFAASPTYTLVTDLPRAPIATRPPRADGTHAEEDDG